MTVEEQVRLKPYKDSVGKTTIGIGRNLDDRGITRDEALMMRDNDLEASWDDLVANLPWTINLDIVRYSVLVDMLFNMGWSRLAGFHHMLSAVQDGKYDQARVAGLRSMWHEQVKGRAENLMRQLETGQW